MADAYLMWELESVSLKVFLSHSNDHCAPQSGVGSAKKDCSAVAFLSVKNIFSKVTKQQENCIYLNLSFRSIKL